MQEVQETQVKSLGWDDLLEQEMATHASILAWKILWKEPGGLQSKRLQRVRHEGVAEHTCSQDLNSIWKFLTPCLVGIPWLVSPRSLASPFPAHKSIIKNSTYLWLVNYQVINNTISHLLSAYLEIQALAHGGFPVKRCLMDRGMDSFISVFRFLTENILSLLCIFLKNTIGTRKHNDNLSFFFLLAEKIGLAKQGSGYWRGGLGKNRSTKEASLNKTHTLQVFGLCSQS